MKYEATRARNMLIDSMACQMLATPLETFDTFVHAAHYSLYGGTMVHSCPIRSGTGNGH